MTRCYLEERGRLGLRLGDAPPGGLAHEPLELLTLELLHGHAARVVLDVAQRHGLLVAVHHVAGVVIPLPRLSRAQNAPVDLAVVPGTALKPAHEAAAGAVAVASVSVRHGLLFPSGVHFLCAWNELVFSSRFSSRF